MPNWNYTAQLELYCLNRTTLSNWNYIAVKTNESGAKCSEVPGLADSAPVALEDKSPVRFSTTAGLGAGLGAGAHQPTIQSEELSPVSFTCMVELKPAGTSSGAAPVIWDVRHLQPQTSTNILVDPVPSRPEINIYTQLYWNTQISKAQFRFLFPPLGTITGHNRLVVFSRKTDFISHSGISASQKVKVSLGR